MNIDNKIEFNKIKEIWTELAITDAAKTKIEKMSVILSESELRRQMQDTTNSRKMIERLKTPPIPNVNESKEILGLAQKGECLTPYQLERIENVLLSIKRLKDYLNRGKDYENPLSYYEENLKYDEEIRNEISRQIRNSQVDDYASKELFRIRTEIMKTEEEMKRKAEQVIRSNKNCMADSYFVYRNNRVCVPVKKEYKYKVEGSIIDKSSSGNTLFVEPVSVSKSFEQLQLLKIVEENEVYQILYTLSAAVASLSDDLSDSFSMIEKLDFIFSKGKLSIDMDAVEPVINTERKIKLKNARHPLMDKKVNVPLQFEIGQSTRGIVITGPNTGGKTVAIKTVMLNCMMAQCGLHVTCEEADICMNCSYLCDIGDGQNMSENLSTFSAHIKNVLEVLKEADEFSLVIMDELGSGTDPAEGMGIAVSVLEELRKRKCLFLVTTHYPEVKEYANKTENIVNARMTFDKETLKPTYHMIINEAGESCAFYIADRLGMPQSMLETAIKYAYGDDAVNNYKFKNINSELISELKPKVKNKIVKIKKSKENSLIRNKFQIGDSVMVLPDKKIGIVCETVNEKGVLRVQLPDKKIWINHKRVKLHVSAKELYPEDYDFSIIFDTVENRKKRHNLERKYTDEIIEYEK